MTDKNSGQERSLRSTAGVTMVEMATLAPLLLLLSLAVAEFTFWLTADNLANTAAQRAASQLASSPDTDNPCDVCQFPVGTTQCNDEINDCNIRKGQQLAAARNAALGLLTSTPFFTSTVANKNKVDSFINDTPDNPDVPDDVTSGVDIDLPTPNAGENLRAAFQRIPIEVTVRAQRVSFLPFSGAVYGRARAWKEPSFVKSNPPALDCAGNVVIPGATIVTGSCGCVGDPDPTKVAVNPGSADCACTADRHAEGNGPISSTDVFCKCNGNLVDGNEGNNCVCPPCPGTREANCGTCNPCPVGQHFVEGQCAPCLCSQGTVYNPGANDPQTPGVCNIAYCKECQYGGQIINPANPNQCICPDAATLNCRPNETVGIVDNHCGCLDNCGEFATVDRANNTCQCDWTQAALNCINRGNFPVANNGRCECSPDTCGPKTIPDNRFQDPAFRGKCMCDVALAPINCQSPLEYLDTTSIVCECKGCDLPNQTVNANKTGCVCDPAQVAFCKGGADANGHVYDNTQCKCITCTGGRLDVGNQCQCPTSDQLGCSATTHSGANGLDQCSCLSCPPNQTHDAARGCFCDAARVARDVCGGNGLFVDTVSCQCVPCPKAGTIRNPADPTQCACPAGITCSLPGQFPDPNNECSCQCAPGYDPKPCVDDVGHEGCFPIGGCPAGGCLCLGDDNSEN